MDLLRELERIISAKRHLAAINFKSWLEETARPLLRLARPSLNFAGFYRDYTGTSQQEGLAPAAG